VKSYKRQYQGFKIHKMFVMALKNLKLRQFFITQKNVIWF